MTVQHPENLHFSGERDRAYGVGKVTGMLGDVKPKTYAKIVTDD